MIEMAPIAVLLILCALQTIQAGPVMRFMQATAQSLHAPRDYVRDVLRAGRTTSAQGGWDMTRLLPFPLAAAGLFAAVAAAQSGAFARATSFLAARRRLPAAGH